MFESPMKKITEQDSHHSDLDKMEVHELLSKINEEDRKVPEIIGEVLPSIEALALKAADVIQSGGRIFYIGAGTSGRLGIVDASECPPTYGVPHGLVVGIIAGGDSAIRKAVEFAEDDHEGAWNDLLKHDVSERDLVIGIAASGTTPYVVGGLKICQEHGISTGCITCNPNAPIRQYADLPVEVIVGPEFVTGSTRMKAGTAQKLVLNMISTTAMIRYGRVKGNKMVDMQLSNNKLVGRGTLMVMESTGLEAAQAQQLLLQEGSVRRAIEKHKKIEDGNR
jgi:N-acetylmuramic acid 6-phosphate etherase